MRILVGALLILTLGVGLECAAAELAVCGPSAGRAYFHNSQLMKKKDSGWADDRISGGAITLTQTGADEFDLLFMDSRKKIISTRNDGGNIVMLRKGRTDMTLMVYYPGMVIELYTFFRNSEGGAEFTLLQSKGGDGMPIHKSSVMVGECSTLLIPK